MTFLNELETLQGEASAALSAVNDLAALVEWKSLYLGKQSALTRLSRGLGTLAPEERKLAGQQFNAISKLLDTAHGEAELRLKHAARQNEFENDAIDVTLPGRAVEVGRLHPSTQILRTVIGAFAEMGFQVFESPDRGLDINSPAAHR